MNKIPPRVTPDRDSKYMGEAWMIASFSKDPHTQVGAVIVREDNVPLGRGYNGPPSAVDDDSFSWDRPSSENPNGFSKYDIVEHAEINAMDYSGIDNFSDCVIYVTGLPCPRCMLRIVKKEFMRVVYFDFRSSPNSSLSDPSWREKSFRIAKMANLKLEVFRGNLGWVDDWVENLKKLGVLSRQP